jgi:hypothetical protein
MCIAQVDRAAGVLELDYYEVVLAEAKRLDVLL